jgi:hypothetical protein
LRFPAPDRTSPRRTWAAQSLALENYSATVTFSADSKADALELVVNPDAYDLSFEEELARLQSFVDRLWRAD